MKLILLLFTVILAISKVTAQSIPNGTSQIQNTMQSNAVVQLISDTIGAGVPDIPGANDSLQIYPNPATSQVTIASNQPAINEVRLSNVLGQTLFVKTYSRGIADLKENIDVSKLPAGLYFISVRSGNETLVGKITVVR